jgi:hypothetical protein
MLSHKLLGGSGSTLLFVAFRVKIQRFQPVDVRKIHRLALRISSELNFTLRRGRRK